MPDYFPKHPEANPKIYAYQILGADNRIGLLKGNIGDRLLLQHNSTHYSVINH